jgi:hypothetical protein
MHIDGVPNRASRPGCLLRESHRRLAKLLALAIEDGRFHRASSTHEPILEKARRQPETLKAA